MPINVIPNSMKELKSGLGRELEEIEVEQPQYTESEKSYLGALRKRMARAQQQRDTNQDVFDGMTYPERCIQNRRFANSYIKPRNNRQEVKFTTGSSRQKLMTNMATLINLNLEPDITAFDAKNIAVSELGEGMEDILEKNRELDNDEEKKIRRQYTLMEQGEVFVEVLWRKGFFYKKTLQNAFSGKFRDVKIKTTLKKALDRLSTNVIKNEKVFLGDMTKFDMEDQPFVFTMEHRPIEFIEPLFKNFEMWKYVSHSMKHFDSTTQGLDADGYSAFWTINNVKKGFCEILKYQSEPDNELQIIINGVPMLPIGYPLSEVSPDGKYTIVKQVLEVIDEFCAYGKSLMQRLKTSAALEDEFWRLAIVRGQQLYKPPMINNTGRVLSSRIFMPGVMTSNIPEGKLKPLMEQFTQFGASEVQILKMLRDNIEENSTDPQVSGRAPEGDPTATEVLKTQAQAEKMMGLLISSASMLEEKIAYRGIPLVFKNWFDPVDSKMDDIKEGLQQVYRKINVNKPISGQGMGQQVVEVVDNDYFKKEDGSFMNQTEANDRNFVEGQRITKQTGTPTRRIIFNRDQILKTQYTWRVTVVPSPRRTTNLQKVLFKDKAATYMISPNFNFDWFEENSAVTWGDNPQEVFKRGQQKPNPLVADGVKPPAPGGAPGGNPVAGKTPVKKLFQQEGLNT